MFKEAYNELTAAVARAKKICQSVERYQKSSVAMSMDGQANKRGRPANKRGRPKGSKDSKPRKKKLPSPLLDSGLLTHGQAFEQTPAFFSDGLCHGRSLQFTLNPQQTQESIRLKVNLDLEFNSCASGSILYDNDQKGLDATGSHLIGTHPACWDLPLP